MWMLTKMRVELRLKVHLRQLFLAIGVMGTLSDLRLEDGGLKVVSVPCRSLK